MLGAVLPFSFGINSPQFALSIHIVRKKTRNVSKTAERPIQMFGINSDQNISNRLDRVDFFFKFEHNLSGK